MKTVLMAIAVVRDGDKLLLRKTDPVKNPYKEPWALFGGRIEGDGTVVDLLNKELLERWSFSVRISERLWWDEDVKKDHDGETKRFVYIDALCELESGKPDPQNENEKLEWIDLNKITEYPVNPPTHTVLTKLSYL